MRRFSPLTVAAKMGLCIILLLFASELILLSRQLGEGYEHISGSVLDGISIDKSQFVSTTDIARYTMLTAPKHTISFTIKLTNHTGANIQTGNISLAFQSQGRYIADPATITFDLANGTSKLITFPWQPTVELETLSCTVITTVYDAANDELGYLQEPFDID